MARRPVVGVAAALLLVVGAAAVAATRSPSLSAGGPVSVGGTEASAAFEIGTRTIRSVRYDDRGTLRYGFRLHNQGAFAVTVAGVRPVGPEATLLRLRVLTDAAGEHHFAIDGGATTEVVLEMLMTDCERLSARAASLVGEIGVVVEGVGGGEHTVPVTLPEEVRTGSAREMFCPRATAKSRPPG